MERLKGCHPVFATTFLVMKNAGMPVGSKVHFRLDGENAAFLRAHYRVNPKSEYFFRLMRGRAALAKDWVKPNYASTGLQAINTQTCADAFMHVKNEKMWGWSPKYVQVLAKLLTKGQKVSLFHLATWLYREKDWPDDATREDVRAELIREYSITEEELAVLFESGVASRLSEKEAFGDLPVFWHEVLKGYSTPEDLPPQQGGFLSYLETQHLGPLDSLLFHPAQRLNLITGDNGLGKTFLLDLSWWALTQDWADLRAWPAALMGKGKPLIKFAVSKGGESAAVRASFEEQTSQWRLHGSTPAISGLVIYARVDGSFAVWDPTNRILAGAGAEGQWPGLKFTREEVWDGKAGQIEGLIRDWVRWQDRADKGSPFDVFQKVLTRVSPPDLGELKAGNSVRLPWEVRDIPTIRHPYGEVPIVFESAGIRRIVTLSYLIVWAWEEHKIQAREADRPEERQMVVLLDEAEAHLHPKWQRQIVPALMGIASDLSSELSLQLIVATHSPLVLASSEPVFDPEYDKLFHLHMSSSGRVIFEEVPFELRGGVDSWLHSGLFGLVEPGSGPREEAIRNALRLQESQETTMKEVEAATERLKDLLSAEDPFWIRWVFFAESYGVTV